MPFACENVKKNSTMNEIVPPDVYVKNRLAITAGRLAKLNKLWNIFLPVKVNMAIEFAYIFLINPLQSEHTFRKSTPMSDNLEDERILDLFKLVAPQKKS